MRLSIDDFEQVGFAARGLQAFVVDADFGRLLLLQQAQRPAPQQAEILCRVARAHAAFVFAKGDIQNPMTFVLDRKSVV